MFTKPYMPTEQNEFSGPSNDNRANTELCNERITRVVNRHVSRKNKWTNEEDRILIASIKKFGNYNWPLIASTLPGRTGKQCRERYINQLCPDITRSEWTRQEDAILVQQQKLFGNCWSKITKALPGRGSSAIKNRWNWLNRHKNRSVRQNAQLNASFLPQNKDYITQTGPLLPSNHMSDTSFNLSNIPALQTQSNLKSKQTVSDTMFESSLKFDLGPFSELFEFNQIDEKDDEVFWFNI